MKSIRIEPESVEAEATAAWRDGNGRNEMSPIRIEIPKSVQTEHEAIHTTLKEATRAMGRVGPAAQELAKILHPHFVREEEIIRARLHQT